VIEKTPYEKFMEMMDMLLSIDTTRLISVEHSTQGQSGEDESVIIDIDYHIQFYSFTKDEKLAFRRLIENEEIRLGFMKGSVKEQEELIKKLKKEWVLGGVEDEKAIEKGTKKDEGRVRRGSKGIWGKEDKQ